MEFFTKNGMNFLLLPHQKSENFFDEGGKFLGS
jgi:hypothetical protein